MISGLENERKNGNNNKKHLYFQLYLLQIDVGVGFEF